MSLSPDSAFARSSVDNAAMEILALMVSLCRYTAEIRPPANSLSVVASVEYMGYSAMDKSCHRDISSLPASPKRAIIETESVLAVILHNWFICMVEAKSARCGSGIISSSLSELESPRRFSVMSSPSLFSIINGDRPDFISFRSTNTQPLSSEGRFAVSNSFLLPSFS